MSPAARRRGSLPTFNARINRRSEDFHEHPQTVSDYRAVRHARCSGRLPRRTAKRKFVDPAGDAGRAADVRNRARVGPAVSPATFAEAEKLAQVTMTAARARDGRGELAPIDGAAARAARRVRGRSRSTRASRRPRDGIPRFAGGRLGSGARSVRSQHRRRRPASGERRRHRVRAGHQLSRWIETQEAHLGAADQHLSRRIERFDPKLRCVITLTTGLGARAGEAGRRGDRRRKISRPAARHSVRRQGSARHRRHRRRPTARSRSGIAFPPPTPPSSRA